jgi:hypothetical protein
VHKWKKTLKAQREDVGGPWRTLSEYRRKLTRPYKRKSEDVGGPWDEDSIQNTEENTTTLSGILPGYPCKKG